MAGGARADHGAAELSDPAGKYVVTGDREMQAVLTVHPKSDDGVQRWELSDNATLYDVTHCDAARRLFAGRGREFVFPREGAAIVLPGGPGATMPPVEGCNKQDYEVLIVIGMGTDK